VSATAGDGKTVIVVVEGGVLQSVHSDADVTTIVVDWDEIAEGGEATTVAPFPLEDLGPEIRAELRRGGVGAL